MINCVIIEDEPLAQIGLLNLIGPFSNFNVLEVCGDISDFLQFKEVSQQTIDLLFLDIELPGVKGINFLRDSKLDIPVVITTAYNQYAIEGFELNVLDYLLKPISKTRFAQAIPKIENYIQFLNAKNGDRHDFIYIKLDKVLEKVFLNEIVMVEAMRNYVIYHCETRRLVSYNSLKNAEQSLPQEQFVKVQKSFIVNKNHVQKIEKGHVYIQNKAIALNRGSKSDIIKRLMDI